MSDIYLNNGAGTYNSTVVHWLMTKIYIRHTSKKKKTLLHRGYTQVHVYNKPEWWTQHLHQLTVLYQLSSKNK